MRPIRAAILGCMGKMGRRLVALAAGDERFCLVGAVAEPGDGSIGRDVGVAHDAAPRGIAISADIPDCDAVLDFSSPAGTRAAAAWCRQRRVALVSGTTELSDSDFGALRATADSAPVLWSPNMSVGAYLLKRLAAQMAAALGDDYEIELVETHHHAKRDAPSGTARAVVDEICRATGRDPAHDVVFGRYGDVGPRSPREIGVHAVRMGEHVGTHEVHFSSAGESLCIRHCAHTRDTFALGALRAAAWLVAQPAGLYSMPNVLGR